MMMDGQRDHDKWDEQRDGDEQRDDKWEKK